jgi:hypothetical protein
MPCNCEPGERDGDRACGYDGNWYDTDDPAFSWMTGHSPQGDDDD